MHEFIDFLKATKRLDPVAFLQMTAKHNISPFKDIISFVYEQGLISEDDIASAISELYKFELVTSPTELELSYIFVHKPEYIDTCLKYSVLFLKKCKSDELVLLSWNPVNTDLKEYLSSLPELDQHKIVVCTRGLFEVYVNQNLHFFEDIKAGNYTAKTGEQARAIFKALLADAIKLRASDIRIAPYGETSGFITMRIDGDVVEYKHISLQNYIQLVRIVESDKHTTLSGNNRKVFRTGTMRIHEDNLDMEFRLDLHPAVFGTDVNMRLHPKTTATYDTLGLSKSRQDLIYNQCLKHSGLILLTGGVGTGKSTTLYALLELLKKGRTICTLENPVERNVDGVDQIELKEQFTIDDTAESFLRHDPDIVSVSEVRSKAEAKVLITMSLANKLIITTLHTDSALGVIPRLLDLGTTPTQIIDSIRIIVAQRLIKRRCQKCQVQEVSLLDYPNIQKYLNVTNLYQSMGCDYCSNTGNYDRCLITEVISLDKPLKQAILRGSSIFELHDYISKNNCASFAEDLTYLLNNRIVNPTIVEQFIEENKGVLFFD